MLESSPNPSKATQSDLKSKVDTYIEFPKYLVPEWSHIDRPCCKLLKSLYGHPEAGGHWEIHLTKIIREVMGGEPVKDHPSCFWFGGDDQLLLIVYVDDLLLSGPADRHAPFWEKMAPHVWLEPWEDLDRFLGRHHTFTDCTSSEMDLIEWFKSPVEV